MDKKTRRYIEENQLTSFMNKTKWRELAEGLISNQEFEPEVSLKILGEYEPSEYSLLDWEWVRFGVSSCIEWIDIDPAKKEYRGKLVADKETDYSDFIESILKSRNISYSVKDKIYRVWGYANAENQPTSV